jgi:hypothetical protein
MVLTFLVNLSADQSSEGEKLCLLCPKGFAAAANVIHMNFDPSYHVLTAGVVILQSLSSRNVFLKGGFSRLCEVRSWTVQSKLHINFLRSLFTRLVSERGGVFFLVSKDPLF